MTMHLVRGMTSLNTSKKRKTKKKPGWREAEEQHRKWLISMGVDPDKKPSKKKEFVPYAPKTQSNVRDTKSYPSLTTTDSVCGVATKRERPVYTGDYIVGIATMHKSNLVPVGRGDDPKNFATMRRN